MDKLSELRLNINAAKIKLSIERGNRYKIYQQHCKAVNKCSEITDEIMKLESEYESLLKDIKQWN